MVLQEQGLILRPLDFESGVEIVKGALGAIGMRNTLETEAGDPIESRETSNRLLTIPIGLEMRKTRDTVPVGKIGTGMVRDSLARGQGLLTPRGGKAGNSSAMKKDDQDLKIGQLITTGTSGDA